MPRGSLWLDTEVLAASGEAELSGLLLRQPNSLAAVLSKRQSAGVARDRKERVLLGAPHWLVGLPAISRISSGWNVIVVMAYGRKISLHCHDPSRTTPADDADTT